MNIFLNQLIQFYSNKATNLHSMIVLCLSIVLFGLMTTKVNRPSSTLLLLPDKCTQ